MLKFDNDNIFTGYLKQLLSSFNLPKCYIYKNDDELINNSLYLKDSYIQLYKDGAWYKKQAYKYNIKDINYTKNLIIKNNIYDTYTHNYLGDYLRFLRDYNKINLMPLYNCFSNELCQNFYLSSDTDNIKFDSSDTRYKIYKINIKPYQDYTIAIDCADKVEIICNFYGNYQYTSKETAQEGRLKNVAKFSYYCKTGTNFNQPFVYRQLNDLLKSKTPTEDEEKAISDIKRNIYDLKMFIKIPTSCTSSITVLEGSYASWNDSVISWVNTAKKDETPVYVFKRVSNKSIINYEYLNDADDFTLSTRLQLLQFNTKESYPFANRLIEYLVGNAVASDDEIADNVKRVQKVLGKKYAKYHDFYGEYYGAWENSIKPLVYDEINKYNDTFDINHDILGYVDKSAEKYIYYEEKDLVGNIVDKASISSVDIYKED